MDTPSHPLFASNTMRSTILFAFVYSTLAAPAADRIPITKHAGHINPNSYLVKLKSGVSPSSHLTGLGLIKGSEVKHTYDQVFHGYSVQLSGAALDRLQGSPDVEYIEQDQLVKLPDSASSSVPLAERDVAHLKKRTGGAGVDIYQIDTGIYTAHNQFGGRARWGATFGGYPNADGNGHGTALASQAVGSTYGPANGAGIVAVKAIGDNGSAQLTDIIAGINYVISQNSTRPKLILLAITISGYKPYDDAVASATSKGIHVVVAAGDTNDDASLYSPGRAPSAVTVGAILKNGTKLNTANSGSAVDIWGPGDTARAAWTTSQSAAVNLVGTTGSATSNVAGILAVEIEKYGNKAPAAFEADLKSHARTVNGYQVAQQW